MLTMHFKKQPKQQRSPSPDRNLLSDSEMPADGNLDLVGIDEDSVAAILDLDIFDFCYAEIERELNGETELIGEEEAEALYGVRTYKSPWSNRNLFAVWQESVEITDYDEIPESVDLDSEKSPLDDDTEEADVHQWFDEDDKASGSPVNILDIIKLRLKEVKKFHTPRAFKALTDLIAVMQYVKLRERYKHHPKCACPCMSASLAIARRSGKGNLNGSYFARQIRENTNYLTKHGRLPPSKKDGLHGHLTLLNNENVVLGVRKYLAAQSLGSISTKAFCKEINEKIVPALGFTGRDAIISEWTARNWLHKLGYSCVEVRKGLYHDGHEQLDVIEVRKKFLNEIAKYKK
jgi:hypothetical protein